MGKIIDGEAIARRIRGRLKDEVRTMDEKPKLAALLATDNKGAHIYARQQEKSCKEVGIEYLKVERPVTSSEEDLLTEITRLNNDSTIAGIIIQLPLPPGVNVRRLQQRIAPIKDVEGVSPANQGMVLCAPQPFYKKPEGIRQEDWLEQSLGWHLPMPAPCTAIGMMHMIRSLGKDLYGMEAVVVGHSEIVGKPMALLLMAHFCTVTVCHVATRDLASHTRGADLLVVGVGKPGLITADMVKPGAIVIDAGINRVTVQDAEGKPKRKIVGDVDFDNVKDIASYISPVPGGVGPMTTVMLLKNTVESAKTVIGRG